MRIGVDVDLTVVDITGDWVNYLNEKSGKSYSLDELRQDYDITRHYPEVENPFEFWSRLDLYDNAEPFWDAKVVLSELALQNEIVFISKVIGHHGHSKEKFINKHFPYNKGIVFTDNKGLVNVDMIVDDRFEFLNQFPENVIKVLMKSQAKQTVEPTCRYRQALGWYTVERYVEEAKHAGRY